MINPDTRVAVCCYAGDQHQVTANIGAYLHHGCPVTILSPEDSKVVIDHPNVTNLHGGKAAYIGQDSLDRQAIHLAMCLDFPEKFFLLHDSDSFCLDPKLPDFLYAEPTLVWSNQVDDAIPQHQHVFEPDWPHVAFQPPYFLSRETVEAMLAVRDDPRVKASPIMPFIDYYMVQLTMVAGLPWKKFLDSISFPIGIGSAPDHPATDGSLPLVGVIPKHEWTRGLRLALNAVENEGANTIHSVKNPNALTALLEARARWRIRNQLPAIQAPARVGGGPVHASHTQPKARPYQTHQQRAAMMLAQVQRRGLITHQQTGLKA